LANPTHSVRAKTGRKDNDGKDVYQNVGAAWKTDKGMSIKLNVIPIGFDGSLYVNPIREPGQDDRDTSA
jgi:hypothetical protein